MLKIAAMYGIFGEPSQNLVEPLCFTEPELKITALEDVWCQDSLYSSHLALAQNFEESMTKIQFNFFVQTNKQKMLLFVILPFFAVQNALIASSIIYTFFWCQRGILV